MSLESDKEASEDRSDLAEDPGVSTLEGDSVDKERLSRIFRGARRLPMSAAEHLLREKARAKLKELGISQTKVAEQVGLLQPRLSSWLRGKDRSWRVTKCMRSWLSSVGEMSFVASLPESELIPRVEGSYKRKRNGYDEPEKRMRTEREKEIPAAAEVRHPGEVPPPPAGGGVLEVRTWEEPQAGLSPSGEGERLQPGEVAPWARPLAALATSTVDEIARAIAARVTTRLWLHVEHAVQTVLSRRSQALSALVATSVEEMASQIAERTRGHLKEAEFEAMVRNAVGVSRPKNRSSLRRFRGAFPASVLPEDGHEAGMDGDEEEEEMEGEGSDGKEKK